MTCSPFPCSVSQNETENNGQQNGHDKVELCTSPVERIRMRAPVKVAAEVSVDVVTGGDWCLRGDRHHPAALKPSPMRSSGVRMYCRCESAFQSAARSRPPSPMTAVWFLLLTNLLMTWRICWIRASIAVGHPPVSLHVPHHTSTSSPILYPLFLFGLNGMSDKGRRD